MSDKPKSKMTREEFEELLTKAKESKVKKTWSRPIHRCSCGYYTNRNQSLKVHQERYCKDHIKPKIKVEVKLKV